MRQLAKEFVGMAVLLAAGGAAPAAWAVQAFQESAGQVVMEAENYDAKTPRNGKDWILETTKSGYAGSGYLTSLPNTGTTTNTNYATTTPELIYNVSFTTAGTYYVWTRGQGNTGNDDSGHAGLDGIGPTTADRLAGFYTSGGAWMWKRDTMDSAPATLVISSPGLHTIHLWMREDGLRVDKILLRTSSSSTAPSGTGPAQSQRVTIGTADTTKPTVSLTAPSAGATVGGSAVQVAATASDNVGVAGVQFKLDGANLGTEDTSAPYAVTWNTTAAADGAHNLTAVARDAASNTQMSSAITVAVDNTAPVLSITSPVEGQIITAPTP